MDPSPSAQPTSFTLTHEQRREVETNRLRAKAKQREKERLASSSLTSLNAYNKRGLTNDATVVSLSASAKPLDRDSRLGTYFEYDLSKMVNSKGGFLLEEVKEVDNEVRRKEKEREMQRTRQEQQPVIFLDPSKNPKCWECGTIDIDTTFHRVFGCLVCKKCQIEKPEKYSLLTKTECKLDYLLTDPEMRDKEELPNLLKANPHKSTYANMMLFLRYQVEEFAWKKWGSPEALDAEYERRLIEKKKKKNKKFEEGLKFLRNRTRETTWQKRKDEEHQHEYDELETNENGIGMQACRICGFSFEVEKL